MIIGFPKIGLAFPNLDVLLSLFEFAQEVISSLIVTLD